ncbi:MAG: hypothetical protein OCU24_04245 [Candidatus Methanospirare jalkutatii]|nr:hypothetical protein [Candidatus Methanospirare jalkutatii]
MSLRIVIVAPVVPAPVVPLAFAHSPKQRRISFFAKAGGIFVACREDNIKRTSGE